jgi:polysaccharide biosynthesis/export protein
MKNMCLSLLIYGSILVSCSARRDLVYFSNLKALSEAQDISSQQIKIQENDLLKITVSSASSESNVLFASNTGSGNAETNYKAEGYRVDKDGFINYPTIGKIKVDNLNLDETQQLISKQLNRLVKNPIVDIQLINFKVTVIGEVNKPASFIVPGDKINLLEALGMAGDMTVYGKRQDVLIIRQENGKRLLKRLDLNNEDVLNSPFFSLKQNDIVYVEPDKSKAIEYSANTRLMPIVIASISAVAVLITAVLNR